MAKLLVATAAAVLLATPAWAQGADCSGFKWPVGRESSDFGKQDLPGVASGGALPGLATAAELRLVPQDQVAYAVPPHRKPKRTPAYGGSFTLPSIPTADTYQVTVSDEAWIDVVQGGKTLRQVGFTGGHACAAVHKSVRFPLATGPATVEISDAAKDSLKIEVLPKSQ